MAPPELLSTALDVSLPRRWLSSSSSTRRLREDPTTLATRPVPDEDPELLLPKRSSLVIIIVTNIMLQISFFIIVSSSNLYAEHLGGSATFSGVVIGIPTLFSGMCLIPLVRIDKGKYTRPLHFACGSSVLGHVLYAVAYKANWLYLILIGRIVSGLSFTFFMYTKRYCSDPRIVGIRRRTTLAGWLVVGQATGFSLGPFVGGALYKIGFSNAVFNGYTSPAWLMAVLWTVFWVVVYFWFEDVPETPPSSSEIELPTITNSSQIQPRISDSKDPSEAHSSGLQTPPTPEEPFRMTKRQWGVTGTMCWFAMTCFFILGAWEANLPVFTGATLNYSPFAAGNLIALGGVCTFPFLIANVLFARKYQDRNTLAIGTLTGSLGLFIMIALLETRTYHYGSLFVCWFLIALGFNLASTVTLSLLSKQLPGKWNGRTSLIIQYSNYTGRVTGAIWGGAGVKVGMISYACMQIGIVAVGFVMFSTLWKNLKAKTG
ncbi:major facilitator superfamily domain-containing protein [Cristinia sonorae]|uniref:Major facilitator superfamily domain-containing protein n=1 Tax=Cristinia sonorae TaxID=1940300 RepID=A0A8K0UVE4_9AGAR|nr:major facilitator superfamily domain-containing protein [Cristinia sonorae]